MKILVCGGRTFAFILKGCTTERIDPDEHKKRIEEYKYIHDVLRSYVMAFSQHRTEDGKPWLPKDITIIEGGARGADSAAADFALINCCPIEEYQADWKRHGTSAGPIRNRRMLEEGKPDLVIAFPGGKGTANMIAQARAYKVPVVQYDGVTLPNLLEGTSLQRQKQDQR